MKLLFITNNPESQNYISSLNSNDYNFNLINLNNLPNYSLKDYQAIILAEECYSLDTINKIRNSYHNIPIILLFNSNYPFQEEDNVIYVNPLQKEELAKALKHIKEMSNKKIISFDNLSIDTNSLILSTPHSSIYLTRQEYLILSLLINAEDKLYSSEDIFCHVWGYHSDCDFSIVWVYLSYIRKKLKQINSDVQIKVIRNKGYYLSKI